MTMLRAAVIIGSLGGCLGLAMAPVAPAQAADLLIGGGEEPSSSYRTAGALCRVLDRSLEAMNCEVLATSGPLFNLENVESGALELGVVPSDWQHWAVTKSGPFRFADRDFTGLRSLFSLQARPLAVVVNQSSGIRELADLKGHNVNLGAPGSSERAMMTALLSAASLAEADFALAEELPSAEQSFALCQGGLDAVPYATAHPDRTVERLLAQCESTLLDLADVVDAAIAAHPWYVALEIPAAAYAATQAPTASFGVRLTVVASADLDPQAAYEIVAAVVRNLDRLGDMVPALRFLDPAQMAQEGLTAPLHAGAERFFSEKSLR